MALNITKAGERPRELVVSGGTLDSDGRYCLSSDIRVTARF
jgi:hypothetical protein